MKSVQKTKKCTVCNKVKSLSEFYTRLHPSRPASRIRYFRPQCKKCHYQKTKKFSAISIKKYPERAKARWAVKWALKSGVLKRKPCRVCGKTEVEGHHPDYSQQLKVVWLCQKHHELLHHKYKEVKRKTK